jgi:hypothetical protein
MLPFCLKAPDKGNANGPHRVMAQALMKRAIGDIPIVTHIQKESAGMNKLYSQSMCSVTQWRAYQGAEAMVSGEVDEVRSEADEIEPGWSQVRCVCALFYLTWIPRLIAFFPHRLFGGKQCNTTTC